MIEIKKIKNYTCKIILLQENSIPNIVELTDIEKKIITQKFKDGLSIIEFSKENKTLIFCIAKYKDKKYLTRENIRILGNKVYKRCIELHEYNIVIEAIEIDKKNIKSFIEGIALSNYAFDKYLTKKSNKIEKITLENAYISKEKVQELNNTIASITIAKNLVNEPVSYLNAPMFSSLITQYAKNAGYTVKILDQKTMERKKMGGIVGVNKGSSTPATFNIIEYNPKNAVNTKPLVLVGKGVMFDTGGLSLKPTKNSMDMMKCDMAGAATVVGIIHNLALNKIPYHIIGLIPAVENRPGYEAICPGDIITMYDGTTVEVLDTDAEGRLILADALAYAKELNPELVFDFATLTGAAMRAIGKEAAVIMGTASTDVKKQLQYASKKTYERIVEFPLWEDYTEYMKSDIAELKNLGPTDAGAITAGVFLKHFTNYPWVHFDIAGPAFLTAPYNYRGKFATAYGIRLIYKFIQTQIKDVARNKKD